MARTKLTPRVTIQNLEEADRILQEMSRLKADMERIDRESEAEIEGIKARVAAQAGPVKNRLRDLEASLNLFAVYYRDTLFEGRRTVGLVFGSFGWRKSTRLLPGPRKTWAQVKQRIQELGLRQAIRVREEVDREELRKWSDKELQRVGVRKVCKEAFWYDLNRESVSRRVAANL